MGKDYGERSCHRSRGPAELVNHRCCPFYMMHRRERIAQQCTFRARFRHPLLLLFIDPVIIIDAAAAVGQIRSDGG